ncbi:hypothetical protein SMKC058_12440 [Serratia marcescens]|nr:hypothetical protein SMKC058_12440 [Serratia marcescens]
MLSIQDIINDEDPNKSIGQILDDLHSKGPVDNKLIEKLTYYKEFHADKFAAHEENIVSILGLFYKNKSPSNLYSFILGAIGKQYKKQYKEYLTLSRQVFVMLLKKNNSFLYQRLQVQGNLFQ